MKGRLRGLLGCLVSGLLVLVAASANSAGGTAPESVTIAANEYLATRGATLMRRANPEPGTRIFATYAKSCVGGVRRLQRRERDLPARSMGLQRLALHTSGKCLRARDSDFRVRGGGVAGHTKGLIYTANGLNLLWQAANAFAYSVLLEELSRHPQPGSEPVQEALWFRRARAHALWGKGMPLVRRGLLLVDRKRRTLGMAPLSQFVLGPRN
jgi:hypothetical protein